MLNKFVDTIKNLDKKIQKIMINGLYFSFFIAFISTCFLIYYISFSTSNLIYYIGLEIMHLAISCAVYFFSVAIAFDKIKRELS